MKKVLILLTCISYGCSNADQLRAVIEQSQGVISEAKTVCVELTPKVAAVALDKSAFCTFSSDYTTQLPPEYQRAVTLLCESPTEQVSATVSAVCSQVDQLTQLTGEK